MNARMPLERRGGVAARGMRLVAATALCWRVVCGAAVTVKLRPKEVRCVWNEMSKGEKGTVEVFVEAGGKLNARLEIVGPYALDDEGTPALWDERVVTLYDKVFSSAETDSTFASPTTVAFEAKAPGAYKACVDSAGARFENKVVSIEFRTSGAGDPDDDLPVALRHDPKDPEGVAQLTKRLVAVRTELARLKEKQARERRRLAHHRAINDASHISIVEGSLLETVVYVFASSFQIFFVRKWFEGKGVTTIFGTDNV
mmetsp:Transcript_20761/g.65292  ORF Transcript_20761/g.65292 Transcript_20761/m.65292 type:complete len:257 (-) Transcript_20761:31-801(-)